MIERKIKLSDTEEVKDFVNAAGNVILKLMYVTAEQSLMQNLCLECFI